MEGSTEQYTALARDYDRLTFDVDYAAYADAADRLFKKNKIPGNTVLELACGTGSLSFELDARGYDMICSDISEDMLSEAMNKWSGRGNMPLFICQDMTELDLYGSVDACVCCLDSINYLTELWQVKRAFKRLSMFMNKGGVFFFDVKSDGLFREMSGLCSAWEEEDFYAVWQYGYDPKSMRAAHTVDIFERLGVLYRRSSEVHYQRAYTRDKLTELLELNGFKLLGVYSDLKGHKAKNETGRLYFAAVKK